MSRILLALLIVLIAVGSVWMFVSGNWWFTPTISEHGAKIDDQFKRTAWVVGIGFFSSQIALAYAIFKFSSKGKERAKYTHGNNKVELIWTVITAGVFVTVAIFGQFVWANLHLNQPGSEAEQIEVVAQQFQ